MIRALAFLVLSLFAPPALADRFLCDDAARHAARVTGVPADILRAIALTESKRDGTAWPWTINHQGQGFWFANSDAARRAAETVLSSGGSADIGCFQINSRWHGQAFSSLSAMFDPQENALYAARYLVGLRDRFGDWEAAIAAYHSRNAERGAAYLAKVQLYREALSDGFPPDLGPVSIRRNRFPLLLAGDPASPGSVMPRMPGNAPLIGGP